MNPVIFPSPTAMVIETGCSGLAPGGGLAIAQACVPTQVPTNACAETVAFDGGAVCTNISSITALETQFSIAVPSSVEVLPYLAASTPVVNALFARI
jgi:hypothetical protein